MPLLVLVCVFRSGSVPISCPPVSLPNVWPSLCLCVSLCVCSQPPQKTRRQVRGVPHVVVEAVAASRCNMEMTSPGRALGWSRLAAVSLAGPELDRDFRMYPDGEEISSTSVSPPRHVRKVQLGVARVPLDAALGHSISISFPGYGISYLVS